MSASPAPAPQKTEKGTQPTTYMILRASTEGDDEWQVVAKAVPGPISTAIKQVAGKTGGGRYVAVAQRSWKPTNVNVSQQTKVTLG